MKYTILSLLIMMTIGCTYDVIDIPTECAQALTLEVENKTNASCGSQNGTFTILVSTNNNGNEPLTFKLNNETPQSSSTFSELTAGTYTVLVSNGICEGSMEVLVENEDGLNAEASTEESVCGASEGSIKISTSNASGAIQYAIDGANPQSSADFLGLAAGTYQVNVSDAAGCNIMITATVENASNYTRIETIVSSSCAVSGCHSGSVSPDFRVKDNIIDNAARIAARTGSATMPPPSSGMSISESEIEEIDCWVESGAKN